MNDAILVELRFFGISVFWGMLLLVFYDLLRIIRRIVKHNNFFIAIEDVFFWITCSILIFRMMYQQNNGIIRGFSILAMLLGMLLYHESLSERLVAIVAGILNKFIQGISKLLSLVLQPFCFVTKQITRLLAWLFSKITKMSHSFVKALKYIWDSSKITISDDEKGD